MCLSSKQAAGVTRRPPPPTSPHGGQDDLVEQAVVELLGRREARPLHGHGGGEAEDDAEAAEHAEDGQVPGVAEAAVLQTRRHAVSRRHGCSSGCWFSS